MSEAHGNIVIKASSEVVNGITEDELSIDVIEKLFKFAGIDDWRKSHYLLEYVRDTLSNEGVEIKGDWVCITIFGDEWMPICEVLVSKGSGIELYGAISHEHGVTQFYALGPKTKFIKTIDFEGGDGEDDEDEITQDWMGEISEEANDLFPDAFV